MRPKRAERILRPLAEAGDRSAQLMLGYLWLGGGDIQQEEARHWWSLATAQGCAQSLYYLAMTAKPGFWTNPEAEESLGQLIRAAELGNADAQLKVALIYIGGDGLLERDLAKARHWYRLAAEGGEVEAMGNLAFMIVRGDGGNADPREGIAWYEKSIREDKVGSTAPASAIDLSNLYRFGTDGIEPDPALSERWYKIYEELQARPEESWPRRSHPDWLYEMNI